MTVEVVQQPADGRSIGGVRARCLGAAKHPQGGALAPPPSRSGVGGARNPAAHRSPLATSVSQLREQVAF
jgi:hypothetical protein